MQKLLLLFLLMPIYCFSQIKITGKIRNTTEAIAFVSVVLVDQSNQKVMETISDEKGFFKISLQKGSYKLTINDIHHDIYSKEIELLTDLVLGDIILIEKGRMLEEIVISGTKNRVTRKIDRVVVDIQGSPLASSGNAFDALKTSPGLVIKNDEIAILGKSSVKVMVEGRMLQLSGEDLKNFLSSIPANSIKEIEIITNPSSKYEADGNSGIVNIIYKKIESNSWSNNTTISHKQSRYGSQSLTNNFSYQKNKITSMVAFGSDHGSNFFEDQFEIFYPGKPNKVIATHKIKLEDFSARFLIDYKINDASKFGLQYQGAIRNNDIGADINTTFSNNRNEIESVSKGNGLRADKSNNHSFNAFFEQKLDTIGRRMTVDFDFFEYKAYRNNEIVSRGYTPANEYVDLKFANKGNSDQKTRNYNSKFDFEHPLKFASLSYGGKFSFSDTDYSLNNFDLKTGTPVFDPLQSNEFNFKENTQSIYISGSKKFKTRWETQLGMRIENTQTIGESKELDILNKNQYLRFFPTVFIMYNKNDANQFAVNYGRRIKRPNYSQLNPARYYISEQTSSIGNPYLRPSYSNNFEFSHVYKSKFGTKLALSINTDAYNIIFDVNKANNEQTIIFENFYTNYSYSLTETFPLEITTWWRTNNTLYLGYSQSQKTNNLINATLRNGWEFYGALNNSIILNKSKSVIGEVNFWFNSPFNDNIYNYSQSKSLDLAFTFKSLLKNMNLTSGFYDVFNNSSRRRSSEINNINQAIFSDTSNRYFRVSLTYKFGNDKILTKERSFGNEDIRSRSN